ncbi:MAG: M3 family metallopeptidase, partial [Cyanobacteria bacterium P01_H01_bin.15]
MPVTTANPLLKGEGLPPFPAIKPEQVVPAFEELLPELQQQLTELEETLTPSWSGLVEPLTSISERLEWSWGIVSHLMGVQNSDELRTAYETIQPKLIEFTSRIGQSQSIYGGFKALQASSDWSTFESAQKRIVESAVRNAELAGVGISGEPQTRFNQIQKRLAELSTQFSNHVLDSTKAFKLKLTAPQDVAGLPPSSLSLAAQTARQEGDEAATPESGPWVFTLDYPSYIPFLQHNQNSRLREKLYRAFVSRAASGELDNRALIEEILTLRQEKANLLGFQTFAELSLARKMAPNVEAIETLSEELR